MISSPDRGSCMDTEYTTLGNVSDLPPGRLRKVVISGGLILIANVNGKLYATPNSCTQRGATQRRRIGS